MLQRPQHWLLAAVRTGEILPPQPCFPASPREVQIFAVDGFESVHTAALCHLDRRRGRRFTRFGGYLPDLLFTAPHGHEVDPPSIARPPWHNIFGWVRGDTPRLPAVWPNDKYVRVAVRPRIESDPGAVRRPMG